MQLAEILSQKSRVVHSISPTATLADVVATLVKHNCGSLVVLERGRMVGIITERDILRACAVHHGPLTDRQVEQHMVMDVITVSPDDDVAHTMGLMTENRVRHVPVIQNEVLVGMISIGDLVKAQHDALCLENHYLKNYLHG